MILIIIFYCFSADIINNLSILESKVLYKYIAMEKQEYKKWSMIKC